MSGETQITTAEVTVQQSELTAQPQRMISELPRGTATLWQLKKSAVNYTPELFIHWSVSLMIPMAPHLHHHGTKAPMRAPESIVLLSSPPV